MSKGISSNTSFQSSDSSRALSIGTRISEKRQIKSSASGLGLGLLGSLVMAGTISFIYFYLMGNNVNVWHEAPTSPDFFMTDHQWGYVGKCAVVLLVGAAVSDLFLAGYHTYRTRTGLWLKITPYTFDKHYRKTLKEATDFTYGNELLGEESYPVWALCPQASLEGISESDLTKDQKAEISRLTGRYQLELCDYHEAREAREEITKFLSKLQSPTSLDLPLGPEETEAQKTMNKIAKAKNRCRMLNFNSSYLEDVSTIRSIPHILKEIKDIESELQEIQKELTRGCLASRKTELEARQTALNQKLEGLQRELNTLRQEETQLNREISEKTAQLSALLPQLKESMETIQGRMAALETEWERLNLKSPLAPGATHPLSQVASSHTT